MTQRGFASSIAAILGEIMRTLLIGILGVCVLLMGSMLGCDKEIKEAVKPAAARHVNT